jgi:predicted permease
MKTLWQDVRYGIRVLRKSPGFALVAALTLALGIAANTTVFSWIDGVLLNPLPGVAEGNRLVAFETILQNGEYHNTSYRDYQDYAGNLKLVSGITVWTQSLFSVGASDNPDRIWGELVSGNYFAVLGVKPALGRVFLPEEYGDTLGAYPVAIISDRLWRRRFRSDPRAIGISLRVNQHELTIVGVAPPEFRGGSSGLAFDIWVPVNMAHELKTTDQFMLSSRTWRGLFAIARLSPGASIEQARAEVAVTARNLAAAYPLTNQGIGATILPLSESPTGAQTLMRRPLQILMAVCAVLFLIVCANVANLLLARSVARQKEFSIRLALGSGRGRLTRQLLTETLLLAGAGTLVGLPIAVWMGKSLSWLLPATHLPTGLDPRLSGRILGFSILACVAAALISGVAPALLSGFASLSEGLKEGGRSGGSGARSHRMRGMLVISEIALATVALVGAGIFMRSFENASRRDPGFDSANVLLAQFYLTGHTREQALQFCFRLRERLASTTGISSVTYADTAPLGFKGDAGHDIEVDGYVPRASEKMNYSRTLVAPGYFTLMRIPLLEGRDFTDTDDEQGLPVMIVNETFAHRFFAGSNPIGRKVRVSAGTVFTVVGTAKDIKYRTLVEAPQPYFYMPIRQRFREGLDVHFFLRTAGDPSEVISTVRREAAVIDSTAAGFEATPLSEYITASLYPQKVAAKLLSVLGLTSLLLAAVGLYSVVTYAVSQRTHEIGIRMALGAQPGDVVGMVVRQGMLLTGAGLAAGIAVALLATRLVASMLVSVSAADPATYAAAALLLGSVALLASYVPARRAARVDPMAALRDQ